MIQRGMGRLQDIRRGLLGRGQSGPMGIRHNSLGIRCGSVLGVVVWVLGTVLRALDVHLKVLGMPL